MLPKVILFDLDDTIVSYVGASEAAWEETCKIFARSLDIGVDAEALLAVINEVKDWYWSDADRHKAGRMDMFNARREIVKMAFERLKCYDFQAAVEMADTYSIRQEELICLFPESIHTLEALKEMGIKMALITNGTAVKQRGKIERFNLAPYFEVCLIEEEVGYGKPDIRVFEDALRLMKIEAVDAWMVGDNLIWDIEAPQKMGIFAVWNDYKNQGLPKDCKIRPDRIIKSISELLLKEI